MGAVPASPGAALQAGRQTSLALPPVLSVFWRIGNNAGCRESTGLTKQEHLGCVLALETCQKWDKCRSAISDLYSWLFPGSIHSPFPAVLGWR